MMTELLVVKALNICSTLSAGIRDSVIFGTFVVAGGSPKARSADLFTGVDVMGYRIRSVIKKCNAVCSKLKFDFLKVLTN
jgi:hypothetical protein